MKKYNLKINESPYEVTILNVADNVVKIDVNGKEFNVTVDQNLSPMKTPTIVRQKNEPSTDSDKSTAKTSSPSEKKGAGVIKSPLPGTIISVFVKEGDKVKIGQKLLVWEAMKMENNLTSDREGSVKKVKVKVGDAVLEGDVLIEIE